MSDSRNLRLPPGPPQYLFFHHLVETWRDPIGAITRATEEHGDVVHLHLGPFRYVVVNHPDGVRHVLAENAKNYVKSRNYRGLKLVLGDGLLTAEGDAWRRQRRLVQPGFHRDKIAGFAATMARDTRQLLDRWQTMAPGTVDVHEEMMRLTLRIVGRTLFGLDVDGDAKAVGEALHVVLRFANEYAQALVSVPTWLPTGRNREFHREKRTLDTLVARIVDERRRRGDMGDDLLAMLLSARDEASGAAMTERQLRDEVMTLVMAGHETTANALTWTSWLLARHPEAARRVRDEVDAVLGDRDPEVADLPRLPLVSRALDEGMRLYPPAWAFERQAIADDVVMGYRIPAGSIVGVFPFLLHRQRAYWDEPERFDLDRFAPERASQQRRWTYLPFGGGQRICVGESFALMEARIILAMMARRFELEVEPGHPVELDPVITLRPKCGVKLRLRARGGDAATRAA
jgi:cytochrome P450